MKPSRYNISIENPGTGEIVLFNTLHGSTVVVPATQGTAVSSLLGASRCSTSDDSATGETVRQLVNLRFLVDDEVDELAIVRRRKLAGVQDRNRLDVIVMPNLNCNFACPYCYEQHDPSSRMSEQVKERLLKWLDREIPGRKVLLLGWFGGEPLLSPEIVTSVSRHVRDACMENGVRLLTNVTTNGYCLTPRVAKRLLDAGLYGYQITVDGPAKTHDRTRILKSGGGSYRRVHANIVALAAADSRVRISLRINFNHQNLHEVPVLLEDFPREIRHQLRVVLEPIFGAKDLSATENMVGEEISATTTRHYELARSLGYDVRLGSTGVGKLVYCYAEREQQYIIDFKGDVFKCSVSDFASSRRVGAIDESGSFVRDNEAWERWFGVGSFDAKCESCAYLPLCMGGCRKDRVENGQTGSYCSLVPTNASHVLKSVAFGSFGEIVSKAAGCSRPCASGGQSGCNDCHR